jgi:multiple antibiotic resistance protein
MKTVLSANLILKMFVLLNPLSAAPLLMTLHKRGVNVRRVAVGASLTAFLVALAIALGGQWLFQIFGVTEHSFRLAGGIVVLLLGLDTIRGTADDTDPGDHDNIISILATPVLTGPATMTFLTLATLEMGMAKVIANLIVTFIAVATVMIVLATTIERIHPRLIGILSRILGLFLSAMGVEMMAQGLQGLIRAATH